MTAISSYATTARDSLGKVLQTGREKGIWKNLGAGLGAFLLAAASLENHATTFALGLLCAAPAGSLALAMAIGGSLGYLLFWKETQGAVWMVLGLLVAMLVGSRDIVQRQKLLLPALAALIVSGSGVGFLLWFQDDTSVPVYLLRVVLASLTTAVFQTLRENRNGVAGWLVCGIATLALAQVIPISYLGLGYIAAGFLAVRCPFPAVAMAGVGLDLAQVTLVPMTGVLCLSFCLRLIPKAPKWVSFLGPGLTYLAISAVSGVWDVQPLPGLLLGSVLSAYVPGNTLAGGTLHRKGTVGLAQVRLEKAALGLEKMEHSLENTVMPELDRKALLRQAASESCDTCPNRKGCSARHQIPALPEELLEQAGLQAGDLPPDCKEPGRLLRELGHSQAQLRRMKGDRSRQLSYSAALQDQYGFLSEYLRGLSDELSDADTIREPRFQLDVGIQCRSKGDACGDRYDCFPGTGNFSFVAVVDGMGTGESAAEEAKEALALLRQLLQAGFTASMALGSFNSVCALRGAGGCATVDLLEIDLHSGRGTLYKWGAAPSYLSRNGQLKKIGTAAPPPGLSQQARQTEDRLSLAGGEVLIMLSDGAGEEALLDPQWTAPEQTAGEAAVQILERSTQREDDATVAVVRLIPLSTPTQ